MIETKRILLVISVFALAFASCTKDEDYYPDYNVERDSYLVEVISSTIYEPDQFVEELKNSFSGMIAGQAGFSDDVQSFLDAAIKEVLSLDSRRLDAVYGSGLLNRDRGWVIERDVFTYKTVSYLGQDIEISGVVTFPKSTGSSVTKLDSYSLFSAIFKGTPAEAPSQFMNIEPGRVFFNSAVIESDYEGYGTTADRIHSGAVFDVLAKQGVDCAMAAVELMKSRGVELKAGGYTDSWGYSFGAPTAVMVQKHLEQKSSDHVKNVLNFRSTFASDGPLDVGEMLRYMNSHTDVLRMLSIPCSSAFIVVPSNELNGYSYRDFVNPELLAVNEDSGMSMFEEAFIGKNFEFLGKTGKVIDFSFFFNQDMLDANGDLNFGSSKTAALMDVIAKHSCVTGWEPKHPLILSNCKTDDSIPYQQGYSAYLSLSKKADGSANRNVHFIPTEHNLGNIQASGHGIACIFTILKFLAFESPEEIYNSPNIL